MAIYDCEQRSESWYALRLGCVTASAFTEVLNKRTGRKTYMYKLLGERMTGSPDVSYHNKFMDDGIEREPDARALYEQITGVTVKEVGFVKSAMWVGCSPDGLIDVDGTIEIKCPLSSTHCKYILDNVFPSKYKLQVQGQLWVTGRKWCDFVSFHPDMMEQKLWKIRVERDDECIDEIAAETKFFLEELAEMENKIREF